MKNQIGFFAALIVIILILFGGAYLYIHSQSANLSTYNSTTSGNVPPADTSSDSGIIGTVTISPTCPGPVKAEPDPNCADKPYATSFLLYSKAGPGDGAEKLVTSFSSDASGYFKIKVAPGSYEIRQDDRQAGPRALPRMSPKYVVVTPDAFTSVTIQFDSGIR